MKGKGEAGRVVKHFRVCISQHGLDFTIGIELREISLDVLLTGLKSLGYLLRDFFLDGRPGFLASIFAKSDFLMR